MNFHDDLFRFIEYLPKSYKEELLNSIHEEYYNGRGSAYRNAVSIYNWLKRHHYKPFNDPEAKREAQKRNAL